MLTIGLQKAFCYESTDGPKFIQHVKTPHFSVLNLILLVKIGSTIGLEMELM